ncbi:amino acid ABC transporter permease [Albidovulum sp.]|uniref:amino acid ABC transporter permease n=1 Tax=Albidovulum sp. TaxID=1872424 RepID=UPI002C54BE4B|nr:ABC transporter permease subunit [Paracoccaceae bacterium]MCP5323048.1 ABC transporter permease subunit [Paracoccaceae bacterium]MCP5354418.1 ABC transporter permease subunit [Paracoccaceae bacterium]MCP5375845.1 ABC transporter permease subunit [Paracoccaceae bacterium]HRV63590.1 ABC transporter permease subunit [Albidovulum sp.]
MAYVASAPKEPFRLSMLVYDTRYRSYTIQIVVLFLFLAFLAWLLNNTIENLAAKDKDINFSFLFQRAGYDIDQQLIPYTNDSTHGRALFVGLFNTLIVAFFGCILATIIGVFAGVLRLSGNWVVARLMTLYVETFRNIPLLLWIILAFVIFSETAPAPRDFRVTDEMVAAGEAPSAHKILFDSIAFTNRGMNIPRPYLDHPLGSINVLDVPINLSGLAVLALIAIGMWVNGRLLGHAKAVQEETGIRPVTWWKSLVVLFVPVIVLLFALGLHWEIPELKGFNFQGGINVAHSFTALLIAISLYTGAFIAEAVRAGILAISRGQTEAAFALGLRPGRTMRLVILPQALRVIIPPLISQYLNLTKNTTLGMAISYLDLKGTLGGITLNQTGRELECMLLMMAIYLVLSLIIASGMNVFNTAMKLKER